MTEEKNKLKAIQDMVKGKRSDLTQVLQFSKVQDMENRIVELKREQAEVNKHLGMLERIKKQQQGYIEDQTQKEEKGMEQVNVFKDQLREVQMQRKANDKEI